MTEALTADQVASLYGVGSDASVAQIGAIVAVPEPATMALIGLGLAATLAARRIVKPSSR